MIRNRRFRVRSGFAGALGMSEQVSADVAAAVAANRAAVASGAAVITHDPMVHGGKISGEQYTVEQAQKARAAQGEPIGGGASAMTDDAIVAFWQANRASPATLWQALGQQRVFNQLQSLLVQGGAARTGEEVTQVFLSAINGTAAPRNYGDYVAHVRAVADSHDQARADKAQARTDAAAAAPTLPNGNRMTAKDQAMLAAVASAQHGEGSGKPSDMALVQEFQSRLAAIEHNINAFGLHPEPGSMDDMILQYGDSPTYVHIASQRETTQAANDAQQQAARAAKGQSMTRDDSAIITPNKRPTGVMRPQDNPASAQWGSVPGEGSLPPITNSGGPPQVQTYLPLAPTGDPSSGVTVSVPAAKAKLPWVWIAAAAALLVLK